MHVIPHAPIQLVIVFLDDLLDADDIVAVCEDGKICRFYFPKFKERSRFKGLVNAEAEENQVRTFTSSRDSPSLPRKSLDTNLRHSQKSLRALFQTAHVKSLGGRLSTEKLVPAKFSFLLALAISLQRRVILWTVDSLVLVTGATCI